MNSGLMDLVLSGQSVLPPLLWVGTGSIEVFAVASLISISLAFLALSASQPIQPPQDATDHASADPP